MRVFSQVGDSALVFLVPEVEPAVRFWRSAHDPSAAEGMPAHMTVLYPFIAEGDLREGTLNELKAICDKWQPIEVEFAEFGHFPGVLWLNPDSVHCLDFITSIRQGFPQCLPYGRSDLEVIPHLTITDGASEQIEEQAQAEIAPHLPLKAVLASVALMAFDGKNWVCRREFFLGRLLAPGDRVPPKHSSGMDNLTARQRELLDRWLPGAELARDHSWGLIGTTVLEMSHEDSRYIVKAGDESDRHIAREIRAHRLWLGPWTADGHAPQLIRADGEAKLLLRQYVDGELVERSTFEYIPDTYYQAGCLLASLHGQLESEDREFEGRAKEKTLAWLDGPHRIAPDAVARLRAEVESWPTPPMMAVPTHGDWQPRNWLVHENVVRVIDFGRAELRPALTDFARLAAQQFRTRPDLEAAFIEGYGGDPREPGAWHRIQMREAVATAAWAYQVGSESFERQGHRMIAEALGHR
jgi:2'-5' RNA ligase